MNIFKKRFTEPAVEETEVRRDFNATSNKSGYRIVEQELYGGDVIYEVQDRLNHGVWSNTFTDGRTFDGINEAITARDILTGELFAHDHVISERVVG